MKKGAVQIVFSNKSGNYTNLYTPVGLIIDTRWSYTTLSVDDSLFDLSFSEHVARIRVNNHNITVACGRMRAGKEKQ